MEKIRTRFAPSPTGFLHIGNLRSALYNYLFAKHLKGTFILRIEDTDKTRFVNGAVESLLRVLEWCGIIPDEGVTPSGEKGDYGPYIQSARLPIYQEYADKLVKVGTAYYCICTSERLALLRQERLARKEPPKYDGHCRTQTDSRQPTADSKFVIRLKVPESGMTKFNDIIRGEVEFKNALIDDQVLMKSDGYPTYHLANVVDDHLMKITHVIRGEEWLSSTPKHILLYKAFGWKPPQFAHLPLLLNADHSKLSKRQGDVAVEDYIKKGYLREAILNFIALLGFNPRADKELYTLDELVAEFNLTKVNKSGAVVNFEKLDWMNGNYIRQMPLDTLVELAMPFLPTDDTELARKVVALEQERLKRLADFKEVTEFFFIDQPRYEPGILVWKKMKKEAVTKSLQALYDALIGIYGDPTPGQTEDGPHRVAWDAPTLEREIKAWIEQSGEGVGETLWPMRVALSGRMASPPPFDIAAILGKEKTLKRIRYAIELAKKL